MLRLVLSRAGRAASLLSRPSCSLYSPSPVLSRISIPTVRHYSSTEIKTLNTEPTTPTIHETTISITTENTKTTDSILETTTATTTTPQDTINDTTKEGEGKGEPVESEDEQTLRTRRYYGHRIFIATRTEDYALVFKYCMEMKQMGLKPDIFVMELVIDALANVRSLDKAFIVFEQLLQLGMRPSRKIYDSLMKVCDIHGNHKVAQILVMKMRDFGVWPELSTHNYLISIFTKANLFERAWAEYSAVKAIHGGVHPDILQNYFLLVTQTKNPYWTLKLLQEMLETNVANRFSELILSLEVFLETKYFEGCKFVFDLDGTILDEGTLVQILHMAGRLKDEEAVIKVFNCVRAVTQDSPSRTAYFALLNSCVYSRNARKFLDIVNTMAAGGYKLGSVFTDVFARICETPAQLDAARKHLEAQLKRGKESGDLKRVSVDALSAVMRAYARIGEVQRATDLFSACLSVFKLMPDIESFNSVIKACEGTANVDGAVTLVNQMAANGVAPSAETYHILIDVCVAAQDLDRAIAVLSQMVQNNLPPTYQLYARLASLCAEMKNYEQAQAILEAMTSNGLVPDELLIHTVMKKDPPPKPQST